MTDGEDSALIALHVERFAFVSLDEFTRTWHRLGEVRGQPVRVEEVNEEFTDLFDIKDAGVDGAFLDFLADEVKRDVSFPDGGSFGEVVRWALENRLSEPERQRLERWRSIAWGLGLLVVAAVVAAVVAKLAIGAE